MRNREARGCMHGKVKPDDCYRPKAFLRKWLPREINAFNIEAGIAEPGSWRSQSEGLPSQVISGKQYNLHLTLGLWRNITGRESRTRAKKIIYCLLFDDAIGFFSA